VEEQNRPRVSGFSYSASRKTQIFIFFLPLHQPNNHFENIPTFVCPSLTQYPKKILGRKNIGGAFTSPLAAPS
jgi:hypothetical protein